MTYEQQTAHAAETLTRVHDIAREMSSQSGVMWTTDIRNDMGGRWIRVDGLAVYFHTSRWTGKASVHVSADIPNDADGSRPYLRDEDKIDGINVGTGKTDAQIARDVLRRLVTPYEPIWIRLTERTAATVANYKAARTFADHVAAGIGAEVWAGRNGDNAGAHEHEIIRHNRQNIGTLKVNYHGLATMEITLPIQAAINLINAQPRRAAGE